LAPLAVETFVSTISLENVNSRSISACTLPRTPGIFCGSSWTEPDASRQTAQWVHIIGHLRAAIRRGRGTGPRPEARDGRPGAARGAPRAGCPASSEKTGLPEPPVCRQAGAHGRGVRGGLLFSWGVSAPGGGRRPAPEGRGSCRVGRELSIVG
jgi:hypothetical protein